MNEHKLTIITPTYNRAYILHKCYNSLVSQSNKNFIWLVVDDGSTDNTKEIIDKWISEKKIDIIYFKKNNGGKASALNLAISNLTTEFCVCLDSDDYFYDGTVEKALKELESINDVHNCCGVLALRNNEDGTVIGNVKIPEKYQWITAKNIFLDLELKTELICFYKTNVIQKYRFPEFDDENFVSPAWMQYSVTKDNVFKTSWESLCCCEYIADGLTKNKRKIIVKNPKGYTCVKRFGFELSPTLITKVKYGIMYDCGCIIGNDKQWFNNSPRKIWSVLLYPFALIVYFIRFKKIKDELRK